ncbi:ethanolamine ammonia-lyase reactivating factor EutA [Ferdinandcohnia quinoae]|uniref:Ethanolamine ammonia-lyase reactivating factor EutA n=1 Tax=Fredinandcohnia quinoae TaxID=2918902 RepID=A0AAW5DXG3_9BACI|nr:ethanolamine ammonia-lyase reactivating factor EutA [Fredinandcohnia sp. SECRCQ15]
MEKGILSVGIDIGTSTSKFIISFLKLGRISSHSSLPHYDIISRNVIYESEIISTPIKSSDEIDTESLSKWIEIEYKKANIRMEEIKSGAVIITGETAIKKNADALLHYLAGHSGDFVVAIAGASLEAILAGKGSGASEHSNYNKGTIANIDIGGGTANVAFFQNGDAIGMITFHVGGRLIEINHHGKILRVSPALNPWLEERGHDVKEGQKISFPSLKKIIKELCSEMLDVLSGRLSITELQTLVHSTSLDKLPKIDKVMISGGVGYLMKEKPPSTFQELSTYNDIGPLLATELLGQLKNYPFEVEAPTQTTRATVIGAGMQSTEISGSTIYLNKDALPLRNVPVMTVNLTEENNIEEIISNSFLNGKEIYGEQEDLPFAIYIVGLEYHSYSFIKKLAQVLSSLYISIFPTATSLVIICENDMAKALGQSIQLVVKSTIAIICIDQIAITQGDYIDIGQVVNETMVPVVVKTLAFS